MQLDRGDLPREVDINCPDCGDRITAYKINSSSAYKISHTDCGVSHTPLPLGDVEDLALEPVTTD